MAALLQVVEGIDNSTIKLPTLFIYSDMDNVVVPEQTDAVVAHGAVKQKFSKSMIQVIRTIMSLPVIF